jgi:hypothetical protein
MRSVRRETLRRMLQEFPTVSWGENELNELVAPSLGVITGFQQLLRNVEALARTDLAETPLAGSLRGPNGPK